MEYCSNVTGGRNCRLEVNIGGQMEVKHENLLNSTHGRPFIGFLYLEIHVWHQNTAQMLLEVITVVWRSKLEVNWRSNIKIYCIAILGVLSQDFRFGEFISGIRILLRCHWRSFGGQNWRSHLGQTSKSTLWHLWMSFYRIFVSGNPYLALE